MDKKVVFCIPTYPFKPHQATLDSLRDSVPAVEKAGWDHALVHEVGNPYISAARATMLRKALDAKATDIVFIDHDVSWRPSDLVKLLDTEGDVVTGTYRFKKDEEEYMGGPAADRFGRPVVRQSDGALEGDLAPAGFMRVSRNAINLLIAKYPDLVYGEQCSPSFDLFNHGAHKGAWWGEDYAFYRRWCDLGQQFWIVPDMNIDHHSGDKVYKGNYHQYLLKQPGGSESADPVPPWSLAQSTKPFVPYEVPDIVKCTSYAQTREG